MGQTADICIVGAGLAGLHLAGLLEASGRECLLIDKGRSPGGRAATRRIGEARVDHGLPWLSGDGDLTRGLVEELREGGLLEELDAGGSTGRVWASPDGISSLMKHLASRHDVELSSHVTSVGTGDADGFEVRFTDPSSDERSVTASHVVVTAPMPQAVEISPALAEAAGPAAPDVYDKAIVGLFRLPGGAGAPSACLTEAPAEGISRIIVESAKYPGRPPSVSVRCDAEASEMLWQESDDRVWDWMAARLGTDPPFGSPAEERQVKRWRLSDAARPLPFPFLTVNSGLATVSACGDSFAAGGATGVENALRSARALYDSGPW